MQISFHCVAGTVPLYSVVNFFVNRLKAERIVYAIDLQCI